MLVIFIKKREYLNCKARSILEILDNHQSKVQIYPIVGLKIKFSRIEISANWCQKGAILSSHH